MDCTKTGAFIAAKRKRLGFSQQALAEQLGVTNKAVSKWERGDGFPDITLIPGLARALGVTADELLAGEDGVPPPALPPAEADGTFLRELGRFERCAALSLLLGVLWLIPGPLAYHFSGGYFYLSYWITIPGLAISLLIWIAGFSRLKDRADGRRLLPRMAGWLAAGLWLWCLPAIPWMQKLGHWAKEWFSGHITDSGDVFSGTEGWLLYNRFWGNTLAVYCVLMGAGTVLLCFWAQILKKEPVHD